MAGGAHGFAPPAFGGGDPYALAQVRALLAFAFVLFIKAKLTFAFQQHGLTREETDGALKAYQELTAMDRGAWGSFGLNHVQKILTHVFGNYKDKHEKHAHSLTSSLSGSLSKGQVPPLNDFLAMLGAYKKVISSMCCSFRVLIAGSPFHLPQQSGHKHKPPKDKKDKKDKKEGKELKDKKDKKEKEKKDKKEGKELKDKKDKKDKKH